MDTVTEQLPTLILVVAVALLDVTSDVAVAVAVPTVNVFVAAPALIINADITIEQATIPAIIFLTILMTFFLS